MRNFALAFFVFLVLAAPGAQACSKEANYLELRDAIYANEIDRVEGLLNGYQAEFESGARPMEDIRCYYRHFGRTRPETSDFIDAWRAAHPASAHAKVAKAKFLSKISWSIRGDSFANETYPEALRQFGAMQHEAWRLANEAFEQNPRLIPASDVIIHLANPNRRKTEAQAVVAQVMENDPNQQTLDFAIGTIMRGWGGTWKQVETLCDTYAEIVPNAPEDARLICWLKGANKFPQTRPWMVSTLAEVDMPDLDYLRLWELTDPAATAEEAAAAYLYLTREDNLALGQAIRFDQFVAKRYGYPFISEQVSQRRHDYARDLLIHDPLNLELIEWAMTPVERVLDTDEIGRLTTETVWAPTETERFEFAERLLIASPYDPERWQFYLNRLSNVKGVDAVRPFRTNVIVYSNHSPKSLESRILSLRGLFNAYHIGQQSGASDRLREIARTTDLDNDVICPMVRASRLHALVCRDISDDACRIEPEKLKLEYLKILGEADRRGICRTERSMPTEDLYYQPVPLGASQF